MLRGALRAHPGFQRESAAACQTRSGERQLANALSGGGKDCVAQRRNERRYAGLSDAGRWSVAVDNVDVRLIGRLIDASDRIIVEIRLYNHTVLSSDLSTTRHTGTENRSPFE